MSESVFVRVRRLLSARIEDNVDAMERANSDGTMREAIREIDRAIDEVRGQQEQVMTRRLQAARQHTMILGKNEELTTKARFALSEGRDDLAEGALARQVDLEGELGKLVDIQAQAREEEGKFEESLAALRARKRQMEEALAAYSVARSEASMGGDVNSQPARDIARKVEGAEAAFDRAMTGAGGAGFQRGDLDAINKVAEIDTMVKRASVSERLAALKAETKAA